ncbi:MULTISPECIES: GNAT family N-acetyltransferase [Planktothrix]|nr:MULTISPECIES: GNAT family N-acetyltransferase [Planktothrix]
MGEILDQCFNVQEWDEYRDFIGLENFRIIYQNGTLAGGLCIFFMGQWWGGKSIPVAGLASVGIAPEYRGGGVALELLRQTLRELYNQQIPLFLTRNR